MDHSFIRGGSDVDVKDLLPFSTKPPCQLQDRLRPLVHGGGDHPADEEHTVNTILDRPVPRADGRRCSASLAELLPALA